MVGRDHLSLAPSCRGWTMGAKLVVKCFTRGFRVIATSRGRWGALSHSFDHSRSLLAASSLLPSRFNTDGHQNRRYHPPHHRPQQQQQQQQGSRQRLRLSIVEQATASKSALPGRRQHTVNYSSDALSSAPARYNAGRLPFARCHWRPAHVHSVIPATPLLAGFSRPLQNVSPMAPHERLSLLSRHFDTYNASVVPLSTPYSTPPRYQQRRPYSTPSVLHEEEPQTRTPAAAVKMSTQAPHATLLIPGPIEFDDAVLQSMSHYSESHVGPAFVNCFGEVLAMLRKLFQTENPKSQPFVISGSGTLGWDQVAANLAEPGDDVLVLHTGYFADSFADCFETYGVKAKQLKAPIGDRPQLPEIEQALKEKEYKLITVTHTDTSTGVLSEIQPLAELVHRVSPNTLIVVDGVCSVGCEEIRFDDWGIDVVLTASQKAIGCPAGLSIVMASERAIQRFQSRRTPPASYFASWKNWTPIMQNYEAKKPSYFATPSPQLIHALHTALTQILSRPLADRFRQHKEISQRVKQAIAALGLKQLADKPENQANGMTAIYLPNGLTPPEVLPALMKKGVIFAGGLHKEIATKYVRFGHMGVSVTDGKRDDIDRALQAFKEGLAEVGYKS